MVPALVHIVGAGMANELLAFDDIEIGREWVSAERVVTHADVLEFAELTGDRNPIHLDPDFARTTPFRRCIAHGLLGLSLAGGLTQNTTPIRTVAFLGLREWYFRAPIFPGDRVQARNRVLAKELQGRGRRGVVTWQVQLVNQDGKVVQEGVTEMLVETALAVGRAGRLSDAA